MSENAEEKNRISSMLELFADSDFDYRKSIIRLCIFLLIIFIFVYISIFSILKMIDSNKSIENATEISLTLEGIKLTKGVNENVYLKFVHPYSITNNTNIKSQNGLKIDISANGRVCTGNAINWWNKKIPGDTNNLLRKYTLNTITASTSDSSSNGITHRHELILPDDYSGLEEHHHSMLRTSIMLEWRDPNGLLISGMFPEKLDAENYDSMTENKILPDEPYGALIGVFAKDEKDFISLLSKDDRYNYFFFIGEGSRIEIKNNIASIFNESSVKTKAISRKVYTGKGKNLFLLINDTILTDILLNNILKNENTLSAFTTYYEILRALWDDGPKLQTESKSHIIEDFSKLKENESKWANFKRSLFYQNNYGLITVNLETTK